jgi:hypothetical protein
LRSLTTDDGTFALTASLHDILAEHWRTLCHLYRVGFCCCFFQVNLYRIRFVQKRLMAMGCVQRLD